MRFMAEHRFAMGTWYYGTVLRIHSMISLLLVA